MRVYPKFATVKENENGKQTTENRQRSTQTENENENGKRKTETVFAHDKQLSAGLQLDCQVIDFRVEHADIVHMLI